MQCCIRLWQGQPALLGRKDARSGVTVLDVQLQVRPCTGHQVLAGREENMSVLLSVILPVQVGVIWIFLCCLRRLQQDRLLSAMPFVS